MSRERTDADDFSLAMVGAIVVAVVLIFVIAGLVPYWEKSEASANLKGDPSRVKRCDRVCTGFVLVERYA